MESSNDIKNRKRVRREASTCPNIERLPPVVVGVSLMKIKDGAFRAPQGWILNTEYSAHFARLLPFLGTLAARGP